jgi:molybdate transport system substrate-binding protein
VRTGIAVRSGEPHPDVSTPEALKAALLAADAIYFPDPERATAGIHFANVLRQLAIHDTVQARFRTYPNGATAMRELAATGARNLVGCTQVTEINYTDGVVLVGALPSGFDLATLYVAAVSAQARDRALAQRFVQCLCGAQTREARARGGFEC